MALIKCPNCEKEISDKAAKCIYCGYELHSINEEKIICPECGRELDKHIKVCTGCGYPLTEEEKTEGQEKNGEHVSNPADKNEKTDTIPANQEVSTNPNRRSTQRKILIVGIACVVAIGGILGIFIFRRNHIKKDTLLDDGAVVEDDYDTEDLETETDTINNEKTNMGTFEQEEIIDEIDEDDDFVLQASPDKYTVFIDKYIGMNAASIGYTSLGGDRIVRIGSGYLRITYITEDGSYVGQGDEEDLKNYVVVAQSIEPNTEVKLEFQKDSSGKEYDNLTDFQSYEQIDLLVKRVGEENPTVELSQINPSPDKYTYYIRNYVGKNVYSIGYVSLGGDYRDKYGNGTIKLILVAEDGTFIDINDAEMLKRYVVVEQNVPVNSEIKYTYWKDSSGAEYSNLVDTQTYDSITLKVKPID